MKYLNRGNIVCQEDLPDNEEDIKEVEAMQEFYIEMRETQKEER